MPEPSLAIVIVSHNVRGDLERCLRSVVGRTAPFPTTVAVVDNGSTDGTLDMVRREFPAVRALDAGGNAGFARGNNVGIRATSSDSVLLLNPDTEVPDGQLQVLVRALLATPAAAAAGPRLVDGRDRPELSFGPMVSPWGEFTQRRLARAYEAGEPWAVRRVERGTREPGPRDWVSGACLLARRTDSSTPWACSTSDTSCTPRTWTSVPPSGRAAAPCSSFPERPFATCAAGRWPPPRRLPSSDAGRVSSRSTASIIRSGRPCSPGGSGAAASTSGSVPGEHAPTPAPCRRGC